MKIQTMTIKASRKHKMDSSELQVHLNILRNGVSRTKNKKGIINRKQKYKTKY